MVVVIDKLSETLNHLKRTNNDGTLRHLQRRPMRKGRRRRSSLNTSSKVLLLSDDRSFDEETTTDLCNRSTDFCLSYLEDDVEKQMGNRTQPDSDETESVSAQTETMDQPPPNPLKKCRRMLRRLSLTLAAGEFLLLGQDDGNQENNVSSPQNYLPGAQHRRKASLVRVRKCISELQKEEQNLEQSIALHQDRAIARYQAGTEKGAIISMRRLVKLQDQQTRLSNGIGYLKTIELDLVDDIAKQQDWDERSKEMDLPATEPSEQERGELVQYEHFDQELSHILGVNAGYFSDDATKSHYSNQTNQSTIAEDEHLFAKLELMALPRDDSEWKHNDDDDCEYDVELLVNHDLLNDENSLILDGKRRQSIDLNDSRTSISSISMMEESLFSVDDGHFFQDSLVVEDS